MSSWTVGQIASSYFVVTSARVCRFLWECDFRDGCLLVGTGISCRPAPAINHLREPRPAARRPLDGIALPRPGNHGNGSS